MSVFGTLPFESAIAEGFAYAFESESEGLDRARPGDRTPRRRAIAHIQVPLGTVIADRSHDTTENGVFESGLKHPPTPASPELVAGTRGRIRCT